MTSWLRVCALMCAIVTPAQAANDTVRSWNFKVYLDDKPIGQHQFTLREHDTIRELSSTARFDVKVLFINAYAYTHQATEQWQGDCLRTLTSHTNDNGKSLNVAATRAGAVLEVTRTGGHYTLPGCVMSFAYWNPAMLQQRQLLNAQTGEYDRVTITALGATQLSVRGALQAAQQYRLTGDKMNIELWYSASGDWLALESITDGRRLRYVLM